MTKYEEVGGNSGIKAWNVKDLKEGSVIEGRYVDKRDNVGPNKSTMYTLEDNDGNLWGVWGSTVIDGKFAVIARGKMVKIKYLGKERGKSGKEFKAYAFWQGIMDPEDEGKVRDSVFQSAKSEPKEEEGDIEY